MLHYSLTVRNEERAETAERPTHTTKMESIQVLEEGWVTHVTGASCIHILLTSAQRLSINSFFLLLLKMVLWIECIYKLGDLILWLQLLFISFSISDVKLSAKILPNFLFLFQKWLLHELALRIAIIPYFSFLRIFL